MTTLQIKVSTVSGHTPSGLVNGQLAINIADGVLFWINSSGALQSFNFSSPSFATLGGNDSSNHAATTSFVQGLITALIGGTPSQLNTLADLAAAINNDPTFYKTINNILVSCIRSDIAQSLNGAALTQAQANIGLNTATINGGTF